MEKYVNRQIGFIKENGGIDKENKNRKQQENVNRLDTNDLIHQWNKLKTMDDNNDNSNNRQHENKNLSINSINSEKSGFDETKNMDKMIEEENENSVIQIKIQSNKHINGNNNNNNHNNDHSMDGIVPNYNFKSHTMHPEMEKYINREFGMIIENGGVKEKYNYLYVNKDDDIDNDNNKYNNKYRLKQHNIRNNKYINNVRNDNNMFENDEDEEKMAIYETSELNING